MWLRKVKLPLLCCSAVPSLLWPLASTQQETLKDARSANADMDDDALSSSRQVARLRHALEDSQTALKEAQAALGQVRVFVWAGWW